LAAKMRRCEPLEFLQVSSFVETKVYQYSFTAFKDFLSSYPQSRLTLAGDGPLRGASQKVCRNLALEEHVLFPGKLTIAAVAKTTRKAHIFLQPRVIARNGPEDTFPQFPFIHSMMPALRFQLRTRAKAVPYLP